jgi:cell division transport system permease protein
MAQVSKSAARRGKPSYIMSIIGVTLVLFLLGIVGWLSINSTKLVDFLKERAEVQIFLRTNIADTTRIAIQDYVTSQPYTKTVTYTDKETAKQEWIAEGNEDFTEFIDNMLLPASIDFTLKADYVDSTRLDSIKKDLARFEGIDEIKYPTAVVSKMQKNFSNVILVLGIIAIVIAIAVIVLIDNTIRLAMFSNRFLIKTMQMVGATRGFIARPLNIRAVINGLISALIAIAMVYGVIMVAQNLLPDMAALRDNTMLIILFIALILIGITITVFSTYRSVLKYLRLKLDELY